VNSWRLSIKLHELNSRRDLIPPSTLDPTTINGGASFPKPAVVSFLSNSPYPSFSEIGFQTNGRSSTEAIVVLDGLDKNLRFSRDQQHPGRATKYRPVTVRTAVKYSTIPNVGNKKLNEKPLRELTKFEAIRSLLRD
jgi:hypothetical protein